MPHAGAASGCVTTQFGPRDCDTRPALEKGVAELEDQSGDERAQKNDPEPDG